MNLSERTTNKCAPGARGWLARVSLVGLLCLASGGCGRSDWGYVEGVVTLHGEAVGPGTLVFEPVDSEQGRSAMAHFGEDGRYALKSAGNETGAPSGEYRVVVHAQGEGDFGDEQAGPPGEPSIPPRYLGYGAGLTATVEAGSNTINLELEP